MPWLLPCRLSLVLTSVITATVWPTVRISAIFSALVSSASERRLVRRDVGVVGDARRVVHVFVERVRVAFVDEVARRDRLAAVRAVVDLELVAVAMHAADLDRVAVLRAVLARPDVGVDRRSLPPQPRIGVGRLGDLAGEQHLVIDVVAVLRQPHLLGQVDAATLRLQTVVDPFEQLLADVAGRLLSGLARRHLAEAHPVEDRSPQLCDVQVGEVPRQVVEPQVALLSVFAVALHAVVGEELPHVRRLPVVRAGLLGPRGAGSRQRARSRAARQRTEQDPSSVSWAHLAVAELLSESARRRWGSASDNHEGRRSAATACPSGDARRRRRCRGSPSASALRVRGRAASRSPRP